MIVINIDKNMSSLMLMSCGQLKMFFYLLLYIIDIFEKKYIDRVAFLNVV